MKTVLCAWGQNCAHGVFLGDFWGNSSQIVVFGCVRGDLRIFRVGFVRRGVTFGVVLWGLGGFMGGLWRFLRGY